MIKADSLLPALITGANVESDDVFDVSDNMEGVNAKIPEAKISKDGVFLFPGNVIVQNFKAVILHHHGTRAYWLNPEATGSRPDCSSDNGYWANADSKKACPINSQSRESNREKYGHEMYCDTCPMNAWGSDPKGGRGKGCKESHTLYVLAIDGDMASAVPYRLRLSPKSLAPKDEFFTDLMGKRIPFQAIITEFGLIKDNTNPAQPFSIITLQADPKLRLQRADQLVLKDLIEQYQSGFQQVQDFSDTQESSQPSSEAGNREAEEDLAF